MKPMTGYGRGWQATAQDGRGELRAIPEGSLLSDRRRFRLELRDRANSNASQDCASSDFTNSGASHVVDCSKPVLWGLPRNSVG